MSPRSTPITIDETTSLLRNDSELEEIRRRKSKWLRSTISLCCAMLTQSYLLISVFPYSGFLAMHLLPQLNQENVGSYAGFIASCFMLGRMISSFEWGKATDKYGRKFAIQATLLLSAIFSILFGLAPSFKYALFFRFMLGLSNGMIGSVKTIVSEINKTDEEETKSMALVLGMWGYGFLLSPAISGYLSDPVKQYPDSPLLEGELGSLLSSYPFLLPNIVGCILCLFSFFAVHYNVEETLPLENRRCFWESIRLCCCPRERSAIRTVSSWGLFKHLPFTRVEREVSFTEESNYLPHWVATSPSTSSLLLISSSKGNDKSKQSSKSNKTTIRSIWNRRSTREHLLIYWFYSFLVVAVDESFPLFCMSVASGLGITESSIGRILCGSGVCYVSIQYFAITGLVKRLGPYNALIVGTICSIPFAALLPISLILNLEAVSGHITSSCYVFLSILYAWIRVSSSIVFSTITMTTNRTVPVSERATMNGFSMLGGSLGKALGPWFAGVLFSKSVSSSLFTPPYGSVNVFAIIGLLGFGMVAQAYKLKTFVSTYVDDDLVPKMSQLTSTKDVQEDDASDTDRPSF